MRDVELGNERPLVLIAGPCQIESEAHALECATALRDMARAAGVPLIYKSSFDKANRTSASAARGVGIVRGLQALAAVRDRLGIPVLTDVHDPAQCDPAAETVDILQIPAFLCRQTDLLLAAGETGRAVNVKKGQFLAPWDMAQVAAKVASTGNESILAHGARRLVRLQHARVGHARAAGHGARRATRWCSTRRTRSSSPAASGPPRAGSASSLPCSPARPSRSGSPRVFIETHPDPDRAPSDGPVMVPLRAMPALIERLRGFDTLAKAA